MRRSHEYAATDAGVRLGMAASRTMRVAQELYEGIDLGGGEGSVGLITLHAHGIASTWPKKPKTRPRALIVEQYGPEFIPPEPNGLSIPGQEPPGGSRGHPGRPLAGAPPPCLRDKLTREQNRLYGLIWQRFVASQMAAAIYDTMTIDVLAGPSPVQEGPYLFRARGSRVRFPRVPGRSIRGRGGARQRLAGQ